MADLPLVLSRLQKTKKLKGGRGIETWEALCPAHDDKEPSLRVTLLEDDRIVVHCWSGCGGADIVRAMGFTKEDGEPNWQPFMPPSPFKKRHSIESVFGPRPKKKDRLNGH